MALLNYSMTLVARTNENVNNVQTLFDEVRAVVNRIDNANIKPAAGIDYSKINVPNGTIPLADLAAGTPAQLIQVNNSNVPRYIDLGGEAALSVAGLLTLKPKVRSHGQTGTKDLFTTGPVPGLVTTALEAGTWLFMTWFNAELVTGGALISAQMQLEKNTTSAFGVVKLSCENDKSGFAGTGGLMTSDGSDTVRVTYAGGGTSFTGAITHGILIGIKVA